jgi:FtsZ-binding cell division protein ZapB
MSHWSTDLIIENIHDAIGTIQFLQCEIDDLVSAGEFARAQDLYQELCQARKRLAELEQSVAL